MSATPQNNRILELSELAGGLAHEIRNPLSTLKVNLQLLAEDLEDAGRDDYIDADLQRRSVQRLNTLRTEADRLEQLLNDFLKLVMKQEIQTRPLDINPLLEQLAEFFQPQAQEHQVQLRVYLSDQALVCPVDAAALKQALLNLVLNAQQAMPEGGELILGTRREDAEARIDITDTGMGVAPELTARIFSPFFSTKKGGSGLGLSVTRRIVDEHGGSIHVASEPGQGTCFTVRLPLARSDEPPA